MRPAVEGAAERDLHNPPLSAALCGVKQSRPLIHVEEYVLNNIFRFPAISQNPQCYAKHQARVSLEQRIKSIAIIRLQPSHKLFVAGMRPFRKLRRSGPLRLSAPNQRESKNASIVGRAHPGTHLDLGFTNDHIREPT